MKTRKIGLQSYRIFNCAMFLGAALLSVERSSAATLSVKDFGAKGDGVTDDYSALQAAATAVCKSPGATLIYPTGTYFIARHKVLGGPRKNTVQNIRYQGCSGVTISGYGAKISAQGNFYRAADVISGASAYSYDVGVTPFEFISSSQFTVAGFELNGNVDQMTRDSRVIEGDDAGITTSNCNNYTIRDIYVHHFQTDGILLGTGSLLSDFGATVLNVISANNARQGISVIQVRGGAIQDSTFRDTGRTGAYGMHFPAAGADVEPERVPPAENLRTGNIVFDNCVFSENRGYQFTANWPERTDTVTVSHSSVSATKTDTDPGVYLNAAATAINSQNTFTVAAGHAVVLGPTDVSKYGSLISSRFDGNTFNIGARTGIYSPLVNAPVDFANNTVTETGTAVETTFLQLSNLRSATSNKFFIPAATYAGPVGIRPVAIVYWSVKTISANQYNTDLRNGTFFAVYYGGGQVVSGESFLVPGKFSSYSAMP